jgi:hypothetical protein
MTSLLLTLCLSVISHADSLILLSGENQELNKVPQTILTSLHESGATLAGESNLRSLEVSSLQCKQDVAGAADCSFTVAGNEERQPVKDEVSLLTALRSLHASKSGLSVESCGKDGVCEYKLASVTCMVNERLGDEEAGKYGCGLVTL